MKVAVCISGQPRKALETYPFIKQNLIDANNADVFIHMHYNENNTYIEKSHADNGICVLEENIDKKVIELYNPTRYLIESPRNFQKPNIKLDEKRLERQKKMNTHKNWTDEEHHTYAIKQMISMYYSIYKANELKELYANENGFVYDYVIRIRFDLCIYEPIICKNMDPNFIYYLDLQQPDAMISDWLNIGSNAIMNIYASQYLNMEYMNSFQFYKYEHRISKEPSNRVGGLCEHMTRDLMHLYKIPSRKMYVKCSL
jgi:hypothetical protein